MTKKRNGSGGGKGGGRKPPKEHQWPKGKSGNPKGRPKKPDQPLDDDMADLILAEGFKTITVTEGGKPISLPAVKAVFRAMLLSAMKGNSHAGRSYVQHVSNAQAQKQKRKEEAISAAIKLKMELECARLEWVAKGRDEMEMIAHPTDIEINGVTGEVKSFVIFTAEDVRGRAKLIELRDFAIDIIERGKQTVAEEGDDPILKLGRDLAQEQIRFCNERLPSRFRRFPAGEGPPLTLGSSAQQYWNHLTQSFTPSREDIREWLEATAGRDWRNSVPECDASVEEPGDDTAAGVDPQASSQDGEDEQD